MAKTQLDATDVHTVAIEGVEFAYLAAGDAGPLGVRTQPTLYLHGRTDGCIGVEVAESARALVGPKVTVEIIEGRGHFLQVEQPDVVNVRILEFLP